MQPKTIKYSEEAKELIIEGINKLANAVKVTYGPKGNNVIIDYGINNLPQVTKDGVTVANNISLPNNFENLGCLLLKDAANKVALEAGDGTTTVTILTQSLVNNLYPLIRDKKVIHVLEIVEILEKTKNYLIKKIKEKSIPIKNNKQIYSVATISSNNDKKLGKIIADIYKEISHKGIINLDTSINNETTYEVVKGLKFENGYLSSQFVNNKTKGTVDFEDCYVLITNRIIKNVQELAPIAQLMVNKNKPLLIICEDIEQPVLSSLVITTNQGRGNFCVVKAPKFGSDRKKSLEDLAIYTGAKIIDLYQDMQIKNVTLNDLGTATKIIIKRDSTTIIRNNDSNQQLKDRVEELNLLISETKSNYIKKSLKERLAKLSGGVGIIYVGGDTDVEILQKKDRLEDAIEATKSSIEEGILPGGSSFLYKTISSMEGDDVITQSIKDSFKTLTKILCSYSNFNYSEASYYLENSNSNYGIDFSKNEKVDLIKSGIVDPSKVVRLSVENSISIAIMLLTTDCSISEIPSDLL